MLNKHTPILVYAFIYLSMCLSTYMACVYVYIHIIICIFTYDVRIYVYLHMYAYMYSYLHVYMCMYLCMCVCMYICMRCCSGLGFRSQKIRALPGRLLCLGAAPAEVEYHSASSNSWIAATPESRCPNRGPKDHINIRILHLAQKPNTRGYEKSCLA